MSASDRAHPKPFAAVEGDRERGLAGELSVLRRHWLLIAFVVMATMLVFAAVHVHKAKSYTATASVTFQNSTLSGAALNIATAGSSEPQREADTEVLIAHSTEVAQAVRRQLNVSTTANELLEEVKVEAAPTADVLNVSATTENPQNAAVLANAFAKQYITFHTNSQLAGVATAEAETRKQINELPSPTQERDTLAPSESQERATLEQTLARLASLRAVASAGASVISSATVPTRPNGSGLSETLAIGLLVGVAIALSLIFLLESLDRRVKTIEEFEQGYRLPALVGVPAWNSRTVGLASAELLEPYRILRSALDVTAATRQLDTLMVTSAVSGEGKTTVAVNLARVVAASGRPTVLVELDLRRPTTVGAFELGAENGVTTAITGAKELEELLVQPLGDLPNLRVLPSGALPHNPSELMASQRITELLAELASSADGSLVIVDVPPLNPVADAQALLNNPIIHAAVIVARIDRTTRDEVARARSILDQHMVEPVGIVVTGVRDSRRYGYGYGAYSATSETTLEIDPRPARPDDAVPEKRRQAQVVSLDASGEASVEPAGGGSRARRSSS
jgi:succinoglycan biosynthesis transport protein ExoP